MSTIASEASMTYTRVASYCVDTLSSDITIVAFTKSTLINVSLTADTYCVQ